MITRAPLFPTDAERWQAVLDNDKQADDIFVYAVKSTGIYCRPSCSSKNPSRHNAEFFENPDQAEKAGYRPCKRCTPQSVPPDEINKNKIVQACRIIEDQETPIKLEDLANRVGMSKHHFHRLFKKYVGITPKQYSDEHLGRRLKDHLAAGEPVTEAIFSSGYNSTSTYYNKQQDQLAMTPKQFKKGGEGVTIAYGIAESELGWMIVATTQGGICAIMFGDSPDSLPEELQSRFPKALLAEAGSSFDDLLYQVVRFIEKPTEAINLPLDIQGTVFQRQVWSALMDIGAGETLTYSEVAMKIGKPKSARAVATACGANTIAALIPCHRVIGKSGRLSGYRWGVKRKQKLLELERKPGK